jgi:hypothetical protein
MAAAAAAGVPTLSVFRVLGWLGLAAVVLGAVGLWLARARPARAGPLLLVAGLGLLPGPALFSTAGAVLLLLSAGLAYRGLAYRAATGRRAQRWASTRPSARPRGSLGRRP